MRRGGASRVVMDRAIPFIRDAVSAGEPFFAVIWFHAPHAPVVAGPDYLARYEGHGDAAHYYGAVTEMDEQIGRVLEALAESGRADNTIIVYTADHGLSVGSHGLLGKQSVYEHAMGAPLIFAGPGIPHGETHALTYLYDLMPTLLDQAGVDIPAGVEGKSLRPLWEGKSESVRDSVYLTYENKMRAVSDGRWKLIRYPLIDRDGNVYAGETIPRALKKFERRSGS